MKSCPVPEAALMMDQVHGFHDDFQGFLASAATDKYTVVTGVDGTVTQLDSRPGGVAIRSAVATAGNEEIYLAREAETFRPTAGKPIHFKALLQSIEDDVNQNNVIVGLTDAVAAGLLRDNGAGPKLNGTTLAFFKVDGGNLWNIHLSNGAAQLSLELIRSRTLTGDEYTAVDGNSYLLEIEFLPKNAAFAEVVFNIGGVAVYKVADWAYSGATDVQAVCGVKDGDAGDESTVNLLNWFCYQKR